MTLRCSGCACIFGPNVIADKEDKCPLCGNEEVVNAITGEKAEWPAQRIARKAKLAAEREARMQEQQRLHAQRRAEVPIVPPAPVPTPEPEVDIVHPHPDGPQPEAEPVEEEKPATEAKTPPPVKKTKHAK